MLFEYFKFRKQQEKFSNLMKVMKLEGAYLVEDKKITNGHLLKVGIPSTLSFADFEKRKEQLEIHFKGIIELEKIRFTSMLSMKIITKDIGKYPFVPVKTTANKFWMAKEFDAVDFFVDLDKEGHILFGGQSGGGKTFGLASMITNLIYTNSDNIELYLNQTMKGEIGVFKNCKCVKSVCYTLEEVSLTLEKMAKKIDSRSKLFAEMGIKNLTHYIKRTKKAMKRVFFIVEEASFLNISDFDNEETKAIKGKCLNNFIEIVRAGRSAGVHLIMVVQRSTLANLSSELKSQMLCVTTWQRSDIDSKNIIEVTDAKNLKDRELYVWSRSGLKLLKMPWLDEDFKDLKKYVPEIIVYDDKKQEIGSSKVEEVKFSQPETITNNDEKIIKLNEITKKTNKKVKKGMIFDDND